MASLGSEGCPIILVGNKSDLRNERVVSFEQGLLMGERFKVPFIEVSAKEDINLD